MTLQDLYEREARMVEHTAKVFDLLFPSVDDSSSMANAAECTNSTESDKRTVPETAFANANTEVKRA